MKLLVKNTMIAVFCLLSGIMVYAGAEAPLGMPIEKQWRGNQSSEGSYDYHGSYLSLSRNRDCQNAKNVEFKVAK